MPADPDNTHDADAIGGRGSSSCGQISSTAYYASAWTPLGPAPRAELLHVLMFLDLERAERIGEFWSYPQTRAFAELVIDCEEDPTLRAVLVGMLREAAKVRSR